jgi:hypothetical protein
LLVIKKDREREVRCPFLLLYRIILLNSADGTFFSLTRLSEKLRFSFGASLENPWQEKQFPELFFFCPSSPYQNHKKQAPYWVLVFYGAADGT